MKNISLLPLTKYQNTNEYQLIEEGIYKQLEAFDGSKFADSCSSNFDTSHIDFFDDSYRIAIAYEPEEDEDGQYPLEDILDTFSVHIADFLDEQNAQKNNPKQEYLEFGGTLEHIREVRQQLIGKRAFNERFTGADGRTYAKLVIE